MWLREEQETLIKPTYNLKRCVRRYGEYDRNYTKNKRNKHDEKTRESGLSRRLYD